MHNYLSEVEYDPDKARSNLLKHGVSFAHGEQVLRDPFGVTIEDIQFVNERRMSPWGWMHWVECWLWFIHRAKTESGSCRRARRALMRKRNIMRKEYDFSQGKRGPVLQSTGKTRITIMLDDDIIETFRQRAEARGMGYQTLINEALRAALGDHHVPITEVRLRAILREELKSSTA